MRLPRDLTGGDLAQALAKLGYRIDHQTGSHLRLTTQRGGENHITIPAHDRLKVGTLSGILKAVGEHVGLDRAELLQQLFG